MIRTSLYPYTFAYDGEYSHRKGIITGVSFDGSFTNSSSFTNVETVYSDKTNGEKIPYFNKYSEFASITLNFVKEDYSAFERDEVRSILRWLGGRKRNKWLALYDMDGMELANYFGSFVDIQEYIGDSRVLGFTCTFECTSPNAYSPLRDVMQNATGTSTIVLANDSDVLDEYVWPYLEFSASGTDIAELIISNETTDEILHIKNIKADETITLDNANKLVYSNHELRMMKDDFYGELQGYKTDYPVFLRLVPGDNQITFRVGHNEEDNSVTEFVDDQNIQYSYRIKYRYPIKLGSAY